MLLLLRLLWLLWERIFEPLSSTGRFIVERFPIIVWLEPIRRQVSILLHWKSESANVGVDEFSRHQVSDLAGFGAEVGVSKRHVVDFVALEKQLLRMLGHVILVLTSACVGVVRTTRGSGFTTRLAQPAFSEAETKACFVE